MSDTRKLRGRPASISRNQLTGLLRQAHRPGRDAGSIHLKLANRHRQAKMRFHRRSVNRNDVASRPGAMLQHRIRIESSDLIEDILIRMIIEEPVTISSKPSVPRQRSQPKQEYQRSATPSRSCGVGEDKIAYRHCACRRATMPTTRRPTASCR